MTTGVDDIMIALRAVVEFDCVTCRKHVVVGADDATKPTFYDHGNEQGDWVRDTVCGGCFQRKLAACNEEAKRAKRICQRCRWTGLKAAEANDGVSFCSDCLSDFSVDPVTNKMRFMTCTCSPRYRYCEKDCSKTSVVHTPCGCEATTKEACRCKTAHPLRLLLERKEPVACSSCRVECKNVFVCKTDKCPFVLCVTCCSQHMFKSVVTQEASCTPTGNWVTRVTH